MPDDRYGLHGVENALRSFKTYYPDFQQGKASFVSVLVQKEGCSSTQAEAVYSDYALAIRLSKDDETQSAALLNQMADRYHPLAVTFETYPFHGRPIIFKKNIKRYADEKFAVTVLSLPTIAALITVIIPLIFSIIIAFTNWNYPRTSYGNFDWDFESWLKVTDLGGGENYTGTFMTFNHCSLQNPWFLQAVEDCANENTAADSMADEFAISLDSSQVKNTKASLLSQDGVRVYYECNFDTAMPEFNLASTKTIAKQQAIMAYWLNEGAAGFRFDGVYYYFYGDDPKSLAYCQTLYREAHSLKDDVYLVGEYWNGGTASLNDMAQSQMTFFDFPNSQAGVGGALYSIRTGLAKSFSANVASNEAAFLKKSQGKALPSYFISNHDMDRWGSFASSSDKGLRQAKCAAAATLLTPGTPFMYYGEEIGLKGNGNDPNRRLPMTAGYTEAKTSGVYAKLADNGKGSVGCFNDGGRDGTKGNTQWANVTPSYGFVAQGSSDLSKDTKYKAANMWRGQNGNAYDYLSPDQTVDYVSCHDNYTLYDQMNYCVGNGMASDTDSLDAAAASVACTASVLFSQGIAFLQGGEEILRTKVMAKDDPYYDKMVASYGSHISGSSSWVAGDGIELKSGKWLVRNSYMYGDAVNSFKWDRKVTYKAYFDKMAEAVSIRNAKMGDLFGYSASKVVAGAVSLWGASDMDTNNTVIAANVASAKTSSAYYLIFGGRNTDTYSSIGIGNGGVEIVYTSSVPSIAIHTDGQSFTISNNLFGAGKYEFCLVKRVSNA